MLLLKFAIPWLSKMILRNKEELGSLSIMQTLKSHEEKGDGEDYLVD